MACLPGLLQRRSAVPVLDASRAVLAAGPITETQRATGSSCILAAAWKSHAQELPCGYHMEGAGTVAAAHTKRGGRLKYGVNTSKELGRFFQLPSHVVLVRKESGWKVRTQERALQCLSLRAPLTYCRLLDAVPLQSRLAREHPPGASRGKQRVKARKGKAGGPDDPPRCLKLAPMGRLHQQQYPLEGLGPILPRHQNS